MMLIDYVMKAVC